MSPSARRNELSDRLEAVALTAALRFTRHPSVQWRAQGLKHKRSADLPKLAVEYGIKPATVERMAAEGLDNPAYRFHRDAAFYKYFAARAHDWQGLTWLDVGADTGVVDAYLSDVLAPLAIELCDVNVAAKSAYPVRKIDGNALDYADDSFDFVFFTYVLHHAADATLTLLRDGHRIARKHVVVLEDPKETEDDYYWAYKHDKRATFRGRREWSELFALLGFTVTYEAALDSHIHSRHFYVLTPKP